MRLLQTSSYLRGLKRLAKLGSTGAEIAAMEGAIAERPDDGDVIPGTGGLRKVRFGFGGRGKSGGGRTVYYVVKNELVILLAAYAKTDQDDVPANVLRQLTALAKELDDVR